MSKKMNPLRALFLSLSRMPPALMLLIIIVLAVLVTMMVTGRVAQKEAELQQKSLSPVIVARTIIPANQKIEKSMVMQQRSNEASIWGDAVTTIPNAVGRYTVNKIPAQAQIRETDLSY